MRRLLVSTLSLFTAVVLTGCGQSIKTPPMAPRDTVGVIATGSGPRRGAPPPNDLPGAKRAPGRPAVYKAAVWIISNFW